MKKLLLVWLCAMTSAVAFAQTNKSNADTSLFKGHFFNKEYNIYINLDAYQKSILVPNQEVYGEMPGYLGDNEDARKWLFTGCELLADRELSLSITNDYGSEDLVAALTCQNDSTFILKQLEGSILKVARNNKWVKLPKTLTFIKQLKK